MSSQQVQTGSLTRRVMLKDSAALLFGGAAGAGVGAYAATPDAGASTVCPAPAMEMDPARSDGGRPARIPFL